MQQEHSSKDTCLHQLPALFKHEAFGDLFVEGNVNLDIGGGKYDDVTEYLKGFGVRNLNYDPYNQDSEHNNRVMMILMGMGFQVNTVTICNVLNVIKEETNQEDILRCAAFLTKGTGTTYIQIHEGSRDGVGKKTTKGWQNNLRTCCYMPMVKKFFKNVVMASNYIIASNVEVQAKKEKTETYRVQLLRNFQYYDTLYVSAEDSSHAQEKALKEAAKQDVCMHSLIPGESKVLECYRDAEK